MAGFLYDKLPILPPARAGAGLLRPCALLKQRLPLRRPALTAGQSPYPRPGQSAAFLYRPDRLLGPSRIRDVSAVGPYRACFKFRYWRLRSLGVSVVESGHTLSGLAIGLCTIATMAPARCRRLRRRPHLRTAPGANRSGQFCQQPLRINGCPILSGRLLRVFARQNLAFVVQLYSRPIVQSYRHHPSVHPGALCLVLWRRPEID